MADSGTTAKVIADSISPEGERLVTVVTRLPRIIHSELLTHRQLSRNASSSRAIPVQKMLEKIKEDPFIPQTWGSNKRGMQAGAPIAEPKDCESHWLDALDAAVVQAGWLDHLDVHKQWVNRLTECFSYIEVIITATEWDNFFKLRCHPDAQPEIQELAKKIRQAMDSSDPKPLEYGEWHLPFVTPEERDGLGHEKSLILSVARCARVSYLNHEGGQDINKDYSLFQKLLGSNPKHSSPCEHQSRPMESHEVPTLCYSGEELPDHLKGMRGWVPGIDGDTGEMCWFLKDRRCGNFTGWVQYRKLIEQGLTIAHHP